MYKELGKIGTKVIEAEGLPMPKEIKFIDTFLGTIRRKGCCTKNRINDNFKIRIHLRTAAFTESETGKYLDTNTGKKVERIMGKLLSFDNIKKTLAHEIAHLKYWNHNAQHTSYTNNILEKINNEYGGGLHA